MYSLLIQIWWLHVRSIHETSSIKLKYYLNDNVFSLSPTIRLYFHYDCYSINKLQSKKWKTLIYYFQFTNYYFPSLLIFSFSLPSL